MQIETEGLVIREGSVGESDRLVTLLTKDEGVLRAFARRAKTVRSAQNSGTQLLCYSEFSIFKGREKYSINEARPKEIFFGLREDIGRLALAQYFCELSALLAPEGSPAGEYLRLVLNSLHFLSKNLRPEPLLKAVTEMRMLAFSGYMPDLVCCAECACYEADVMWFLPDDGILLCGDCYRPDGRRAIPLGRGVLTGLRHTIYAEFSKLFAFQLPPEALTQLAAASEAFLLSHIDRPLPTLSFYHTFLP